MTFEERLANLGVEVRDIEINYDNDQLYEIMSEVHPVGEMQEFEITRKYLEAVEIIDRMETALENVCGERDYLRSVVCGLCTNFREDGADACETCIVGDGVPEYWSANDDKR